MRADGSTFPVELVVTRPDLPGPPLFCGYLRDVTERRRGRARPLQGLAEEQAALRRVATAVAAEVEPERLFGARRRGGRARARRARRQHPALQRRRHRARRWASGASTPTTIPVGTTLVLDGDTSRSQVWRTGAPGALSTPRRHDRRAWPSACARSGSRRPSARRSCFGGRAVGRGGHLQPRRAVPARGRVPRSADFADLAAQAHRQRAGARGAGRLARPHRRGQRRRAPAAGAQPARRRAAAARGDLAHRAPGGAPRTDDPDAARDARRRRRRARAARWRSCASWRAGCIPPCSPTTACAPAIEALADRAPLPVAVDVPLDERLPETGRGRGLLRRVRGADQRGQVRAGLRGARARRAHRRPRAWSRSSTTASAAPTTRGGSGLRGLADRVEALGGRLVVSSPAGAGTTVRAELPVP